MKQKQGLFLSGFLTLLVFLSLLSVCKVAGAEEEIFKVGDHTSISAEGSLLYRSAYWNWFQSSGTEAENAYNYFFTQSRLGISLKYPYVGAYVQAQDVYMGNLPENSLAPAPQGPLGIGAIYSLHIQDRSSHALAVRQAYVDLPKLFVKGLSARIGRFDYMDGKEVMYKDPKVNWLKNIRLSERLIGPFGWSSYNRSFDGFQISYDRPGFQLHSVVTRPTQGGFEKDFQRSMSDIDLVTATGTLKYDQWIPRTEGRIFYYYYDDSRAISATPGQSGLNEGDIRIHTFGTHWLHTEKTQSGVFDMLFWGALQGGEWGSVDHSAWAAALEGGYQFTAVPWKPWIRGGYFVSSGDSDPNDGTHETFYQLLPTARKYALFPFYNLMNNEDLFLQAILKPNDAITFRADLHSLNLHEANDLWYMGAGPTQNAGSIFGYIGRPSGGKTDLGAVLEVVASYNCSKYLSTNLYYGHAYGQDVIESIYDEDAGGDYFSVEMQIKF
jgi:hypothetical protein